MKITIVQGAFLPVPPLLGGAVERICWDLGKEFAARGHEVTHISRLYGSLPESEVIHGVRHKRIRGYNTPNTVFGIKLLDLLYSYRANKILPDGDILLCNTFWTPIIVRSDKFGKIVVRMGRYPRGQQRLYRHCACLLALSRPIYIAICRQTPDLAPMTKILGNPVRIPRSSTEKRFRERHPRYWLLYAGRIHPEKGIHVLLKALSLLPDSFQNEIRLSIVGPHETALGGGGIHYKNFLENCSQRTQAEVRFVGCVNDWDSLGSYYREADLFVYPSLAEKGEAFPNAPLESMAYGTPPLVSDLEFFSEYLTPDVEGFVFPRSGIDREQRLAERIQYLLERPRVIAEAGRNARRRAETFSLERMADRYIRLFEEILIG